MRLLFIIILVLPAFLSVAAMAEGKDAGSAKYIQKGCELLANRANDSDAWKQTDTDTHRQAWMCAGALEATVQLMIIHREICPPGPILKNADSLPVVSNYMKAHPDKLQEAMGYVIFLALEEAWPCSKKK